jgi:hypothetical protein
MLGSSRLSAELSIHLASVRKQGTSCPCNVVRAASFIDKDQLVMATEPGRWRTPLLGPLGIAAAR